MKKALVLIILTCMLCASMSGAAVSINNSETENIKDGGVITDDFGLITNQPTESAEVNTQLLEDVNYQVDKYLNFEEYNSIEPKRSTIREIEYPWHQDMSLGLGDWVDWNIRVVYQEPGGEPKTFIQELNFDDPLHFKDQFLEHPWHYERLNFDTNEDGTDDLEVYYSIFNSQIYNSEEGINHKSIRTALKIRAEEMLVREAGLEVYSEIALNYGLIKETSRSRERSIFFNSGFGRIINKLVSNFQESFDSTRFPILNRFLNILSNKINVNEESNPPQPAVTDTDWLALGIGVDSPVGETIPNYYEKYLNVGKENIFSPICFEHELRKITAQEPLGFLYGFAAGHADQEPNYDVAFEVIFDKAFHIRNQFIPRNGYAYYYFDTGSSCANPSITYTTNGFGGDNFELKLVFDSTYPLASSQNWFSIDVDLNIFQGDPGFHYKANKKHTVDVMVISPVFSAKVKLGGIPSAVTLGFDVDLSFTYQQGQLLDVDGDGRLYLNMNSRLDDVILYYPELGPTEPKIEFVNIHSIASTELSAGADLYVHNASMTTIQGSGYAQLKQSGDLGFIKVFYRKADPSDPDNLFVDIPDGIPAVQRVEAYAKLYMDMDDFSNPGNFVEGRLQRTSSGDIDEISGYLPGQSSPIISLTQIPAHAIAKGKLEWNNLKGYAYAQRTSAGSLDPIEIWLDVGTFSIYNKLTIRDGHIDCGFHLAEDGYFNFDTTQEMIGDILEVEDTSTGNILDLSVDKVSAQDLALDWALDMSKSPLPIEDLAVSGVLDSLEDFVIEATLQGKNLNFYGNWKIGKEGVLSIDFTQDEPVELVVEDFLPDNPTWDFGGGVIISEDFHFDIKWHWIRGSDNEKGYFKVNEDSNEPNFDYIGFHIEYDPDGTNNPQYGIDIGGTNVGVVVWMEWMWVNALPDIWWYVSISGNFHVHLLWEGEWYYNVDE